MRVELKVIEGSMKGKEFSFEEHDTFLFGRSPLAKCCLPNDPYVSRNHFLIEVNPPYCRLRDLGSKNGTHVNGVKYGGRTTDEPMEFTMRKPGVPQTKSPTEVELHDGDVIQVGYTKLTVSIELDITCAECGTEIPHQQKGEAAWGEGTYLCSNCRRKAREKAKEEEKPQATPEPKSARPPAIHCAQCGRDVSHEAGAKGRGPDVDYICEECRHKAKQNPLSLIMKILKEAGIEQAQPGVKTPSFPDYEVVKELGKGGMGAVYLGKHRNTGKLAALKILIPKVAAEAKAVEKFQREAEVTAKLKHPNIVEFYEQGYAGGVFFFAMEYVEGTDAYKLIKARGGKVPLQEACDIILQTLDGLDYAHRQNIVHRDLKPPNILLAGKGENWIAKVSDFGMAKNFAQAGLSGMTVMGEMAGSLPFMPPEQVTNYRYVKPTSDIFSIGATLYFMATGAKIYDFPKGKDPLSVILQEPIVPVRKRDASVPKAVAEIIDRALERKPEGRFNTAEDMKQALEKAL